MFMPTPTFSPFVSAMGKRVFQTGRIFVGVTAHSLSLLSALCVRTGGGGQKTRIGLGTFFVSGS